MKTAATSPHAKDALLLRPSGDDAKRTTSFGFFQKKIFYKREREIEREAER
jgi:hypothetical protein